MRSCFSIMDFHWKNFILLVCFVTVFADESGFWKLELSPETLTSVPYAGGELTVWAHAKNKQIDNENEKIYFVIPLVHLQPNSTKVSYSIFTQSNSVQFKVTMWSQRAEEVVIRHLSDLTGSKITPRQVRMLPMEKVRLIWNDETQKISPKYKIPQTWLSFTHLPEEMQFSITCEDKASCSHLGAAILEHPEQLSKLELQYVISGQSSVRRVLSVQGKHLKKSETFKKVKAMPDMHGNIRFVKADDAGRIAVETAVQVVAESITEHGYPDKDDEISLQQLLTDYLKAQAIRSTSFENWNNVFWEPKSSRPDVISNALNNKLVKNGGQEYKIVMKDGVSSTDEIVSGLFLFDRNQASVPQTRAWLNEYHPYIQWDGQKFKPKNLNLYRLNMVELTSKTSIISKSVQIHRYEATHSTKVRVDLNPPVSSQFDIMEARITALEMELEDLKGSSIGDVPLNQNATETLDGVVKRMEKLEVMVKKWNKESNKNQDLPRRKNRDCRDVYSRRSGIFTIMTGDLKKPLNVWCDMDRYNGGWLVLMRRINGRVNFTRNYEEYKNGFGDNADEFWLGNENMYQLTKSGNYKGRFDMWFPNGTYMYAEYRSFSVASASDGYRLEVSGYHGNATGGDWMTKDGEWKHSGMKFTTFDRDQDVFRHGNCAREWGGGGWWYNQCVSIVLTGPYHVTNGKAGIAWYCCSRPEEQLARAEIKIQAIL